MDAQVYRWVLKAGWPTIESNWDFVLTAGERTKRAVVSGSLNGIGWTTGYLQAFENCQHSLRHQVQLPHRDISKELRVTKNASHALWASIVTQIPKRRPTVIIL